MKHRIRTEFLGKRKTLDSAERQRQSQQIFEKLVAWPPFQSAHCVAVYRSKEDEVSTDAIIENLFENKKRVVAPRVNGDHVEFYEVHNWNDFERGAFDIQEPKLNLKKVATTEPDLILVPGIAFTLQGHRIGFGKGHYDRLLATSSAIKVGLAFSEQIANDLPQESHDIPLDFIFTP